MQPHIWGHELTLVYHWQRVVQVVRAVGVGPESSSWTGPGLVQHPVAVSVARILERGSQFSQPPKGRFLWVHQLLVCGLARSVSTTNLTRAHTRPTSGRRAETGKMGPTPLRADAKHEKARPSAAGRRWPLGSCGNGAGGKRSAGCGMFALSQDQDPPRRGYRAAGGSKDAKEWGVIN